ncbi:hypothetical protein HYW74_04520 [Candidatus Pacearchaeota archaeon]|nr:hypothetical protein [Candidatus Pacearchaeota archaeon]
MPEKQYTYVNLDARYVLWSKRIRYDDKKELYLREFTVQDKKDGRKLSKEGFGIDILVSFILGERFFEIEPTKENITTIVNENPNSSIQPINNIEFTSFFVLYNSSRWRIPALV